MSKKKRFLKIAAFVAAMALIVGVIVFANALIGNPVSKHLAKSAAEEYLVENFPDGDYIIARTSYSWKTGGGYYINLVSPSSIDSSFEIYTDMAGNIVYDTYESNVLQHGNTVSRLEKEYRELCDSVLNSPLFPYRSDIAYGTLEYTFGDLAGYPGAPDYYIVREELELDKIYDIRELGAQAGMITLYVQDEDVSFEHAAEILLDLKELMDGSGVPFKTVFFTLQYPPSTDGVPRPDGRVNFSNFAYEEIYEEGLTERVKAAHEALEAYYAEQDALRAEFFSYLEE